MKKIGCFLGSLLAIVVLIGIIVAVKGPSVYNEIIQKEGVALAQWANVESSYQRRADLIPNLVATVKGAADFEKSTLESVIQARAEATKPEIKLGDGNLTPEKMAKFQKAQEGLSGALSRLLVTVERYPELKANQNFLELQSQLEGTENRINVERNKFNNLAGVYNIFIQQFPTNLYAKFFKKGQLSLFKSAPGSEKSPDVKFEF